MTIKKALKILDWYTNKKEEMKNGFLDMNMPWNQGQDCIMELSKGLAVVMNKDIEILNSLIKELKPNCKHPKKFQDIDPDGNRYCMDCNLDL